MSSFSWDGQYVLKIRHLIIFVHHRKFIDKSERDLFNQPKQISQCYKVGLEGSCRKCTGMVHGDTELLIKACTVMLTLTTTVEKSPAFGCHPFWVLLVPTAVHMSLYKASILGDPFRQDCLTLYDACFSENLGSHTVKMFL